ncbi:transglycosylase SLT domain-containing protein, partial [Pseudomonas aeruginosa]|uniref:transglycosylase SLT domain-containing protein n=1 Tax=Pseudomonas aeruginosa TaxID=287 RepID=UPI003523E8A1
MQKLPKFALAILASACLVGHVAAEESQPKRFSELAAKCAPNVHASTLKALIGNESSFNPYAIGVVGTGVWGAMEPKTNVSSESHRKGAFRSPA